ncbi:MAG: ABC transporter substrate-binding protein [Terriglobia bacterium]
MPTRKSGVQRFMGASALLPALLVLAFAPACRQAPHLRTYRIGLGPFVGYGSLYLARDKGFFKAAGIDAEMVVLTGLAERNSALKADRIDALAAPVDYFVLSAGNNLKATIAMAIDESNGADGIVANASIKTIADLRGKKVAFQRGLPSEFFLRALLQQSGLSLQDLKPVDMETAQAGAAFISKQVDAAVIWEPWLTKAREDGHGHILASSKEYPNLIVDCLAFNQGVVSRSPQDVQAMVDAVLQAIAYWKAHPQEADADMAPYFQVDAAKYGQILKGINFCDLARNREYFGTPQAPGPIFNVAERASAIWLDAKAIAAPVKPGEIISADFVSNAEE